MTVKCAVSVLSSIVLVAACATQPVPILLDGQQSPSSGAINASTTNSADRDTVVHELQSTRWVPITIDSQPITLAPQQREPFINLQSNRVTGYGGCNRLSGGYEHGASALKFTQVATTRMACEQGGDIEQSLLNVLESTAAWRIAGDKLELLDNAGNVLAAFVARNL
jgi:heat shock protein HslJ